MAFCASGILQPCDLHFTFIAVIYEGTCNKVEEVVGKHGSVLTLIHFSDHGIEATKVTSANESIVSPFKRVSTEPTDV